MSTDTVDVVSLFLAGGSLQLTLNAWFITAIVLGVLGVYWFVTHRHQRWSKDLEIDEAELGIGNQKIKLRPNHNTAQVAYRLWIELSTRKIGLPIDFHHDVIAEVYDSWYSFFQVTRELLKDIPASQLRANPATKRLVTLAIDVLNEGLRPHLTLWQARFRRWYDRQLAMAGDDIADPQTIQELYPRYSELRADMEAVNQKLIVYRRTVSRIVFPS